MEILSTPIEFLKGVGPARANLLRKELGIFTYYDLLTYFPFRYLDKSQIYNISDLHVDMFFVQVKGEIIKIEEVGNGRSKRLIAYLDDGTGVIQLVWFKSIKWIKSSLKLNINYLVFGKLSSFKHTVNFIHPDLDLLEDFNSKAHVGMQGVYNSSEKLSSKGLNSRGLQKLIKNLLPLIKHSIPEVLSNKMIQDLNLPNREEAFINVHLPKTNKDLIRARKRLKFEELFFLQLHLLKSKMIRKKKLQGFDFRIVGNHFNTFYEKHIPFQLTNAQKRVVKEIRNDLSGEAQMNRLLQGDVGSGKTLVAFLTMLISIDNGFQSCIIAPTEILANQHMSTISNYTEHMNLNVALLTGSSKVKERKKVHNDLIDGSLDILIGTHAVLEDKVVFKNLGLVIIDEQHKFGVAQRAKFWKKNKFPPHILVMTATPIPRTLAMTLYGDLDMAIIDESPPGRKEVQTVWKFDRNRLEVLGFIKKQISLGRQIYIVFPLIKESEKLDYKNLIEGYESLLREFPLPDFQVSVVHGKMSAEDKEFELDRFVKGVTDIMVATTVIEVGVHVSNATVMVIESAERFGL